MKNRQEKVKQVKQPRNVGVALDDEKYDEKCAEKYDNKPDRKQAEKYKKPNKPVKQTAEKRNVTKGIKIFAGGVLSRPLLHTKYDKKLIKIPARIDEGRPIVARYL